MNLKQLKEQRAELLNSMKDLTENVEIFNSAKFEEMKAELASVENSIREFDNAQEIENKNIKKKGDKMEFKNQLMSGAEIDLSQVKNEAHDTQNTEQLIKEDYATQIERRLRDRCLLYDRARKIVTASPHIIPVEKVALGKFVKVSELGEYTKQKAEFGQVKLGAVKYGTMVQISQEVLDDNDFNLEGVLLEQIQEAFEDTVLDLIVKGDRGEGVEGLAMASVGEGAKQVDVRGQITDDDIIDLMFALDRPYREDAIFIMTDDCARQLAKLKDDEGRPLLQVHANDAIGFVEGSNAMLKGKPVVICDALHDVEANRPIMFVDMQKAMVVGIRKNMIIKKSEEAGFMDDSVFIKASVRLDAKLLMQEAIAFIEVQE